MWGLADIPVACVCTGQVPQMQPAAFAILGRRGIKPESRGFPPIAKGSAQPTHPAQTCRSALMRSRSATSPNRPFNSGRSISQLPMSAMRTKLPFARAAVISGGCSTLRPEGRTADCDPRALLWRRVIKTGQSPCQPPTVEVGTSVP